MRGRSLLVVLVAACHGPADHYAVDPGGGPAGGGNTYGDDGIDAPGDGATDGPGSDGPGTGPFHARACLVTDLRNPQTGCSDTLAGQITVTLARSSMDSAIDGRVTLDNPTSDKIQYTASRNGISGAEDIEVTVAPFADNLTFPVVTVSDYIALINANGITNSDIGVFIQVLEGGAPAVGATAALSGSTTRYDGATPTSWGMVSTGTRGVAWIPSAHPTPTSIVVTLNGAQKTFLIDLSNGAQIVFGTVAFP